MSEQQTENNKVENNKTNKNIGIFCCSTNNIGDDVQSLAMWYFLEYKGFQVDYFIDRDKCDVIYDKNFNRVKISDLQSNNIKIDLYINCWFTRGVKHFPFADYIIPHFCSLHIPPNYEKKYKLIANNGDYWKKHAPIGTRDQSTLKMFKSHGIDAFFVGCPTLTLDKSISRFQKLEIPDKKREALIVGSKYKTSLNLNKFVLYDTRNKKFEKLGVKQRFEYTKQLLERFYNAREIYTNRLHCFLPSYALGVNVKLIEAPKTSEQVPRMLDYYKNVVKIKKNVEKNLETFIF